MKIKAVYGITCIITGRTYIGSTSNIAQRLCAHKSSLKMNKHIIKTFQDDWNKYGEKMFIFEILEELVTDNLEIMEQYYMDKILYAKDFIDGKNNKFLKIAYNRKPYAKAPGFRLIGTKRPFSKSHIDSMAGINSGKDVSLITRNKMRLRKLGTVQTNEARNKRSKTLLGRVLKPEAILQQRLTSSKPILQYDLQGNFIREWFGASFAADELFGKRRTSMSIRLCADGKAKHSKGFIWRWKK